MLLRSITLGILDDKLNWIITRRGRLAAANGFCNLGRCICGHILGDNVYQCGSEDWAQKVCHGTDAGMAAVEGAEGRSSGGCRKSRTGRWETVPEGERNWPTEYMRLLQTLILPIKEVRQSCGSYW